MDFQNPVIVLPGITGTDLLDDYPLRTETLWSMVLDKDYERIALHPDDLRYEAVEPAHVFPGRPFEIYNDLIKALRHELSVRADRPTPVFAFPYDWRVDIRLTAQALGRYVEEVIGRTRLLKHYAGANDLMVDLVGHSMGGLIISEYLSQCRNKARVSKVVTIGTPFLGSVEAVVMVTTGMGRLAGDEPKERERESARVTPAVYQLFPSYEKAAVTPDGSPVDLFRTQNMQPSILESLTEFVRMYSVDTKSTERRERAAAILEDLLSGAANLRKSVTSFKPSDAGIKQRDWLAILGVQQETRIQLTVKRHKGQPRFEISDNQFVNKLTSRESSSRETGDGTVPVAGAIPPFLPENHLVCVTRADMGRLELRDRLFVRFAGLHGLLPSMNLVQRLTVRHLWKDYGAPLWGRRLPGVRTWSPPIDGLSERTY